MKKKFINNNLNILFNKAPLFEITNKDKLVIFSDLHMGNGSYRDDFTKNSNLFKYVLKNFYLKNKYKLILNGDIEELHRFSLKKIMNTWHEIYQLFNDFHKKTGFYKLIGNHDFKLFSKKPFSINNGLFEAIKLNYKDNILFIFHGHQASRFLIRYNNFLGFILRYIATPLYIKNTVVSRNSKKKIHIEKNVYDFSYNKKIISIIGHTHRSLFESLSKVDSLRFKIELLCRSYYAADKNEKKNIEQAVTHYKEEFLYYYSKKHKREGNRSSLYNSNLIVPLLFNSGCVIGKRGITAIEIDKGNILLSHWFDKTRTDKYLKYSHPNPQRLRKSNYYRIVFNQDLLSYIFTRIKLLT